MAETESQTEWKPAESITQVLEELRGALFGMGFMLCSEKYGGVSKELAETGRQRLSMLVEFGVRSGLITSEEGNDWLDGIWDRKPFGIVAVKWMGDEEDAAFSAENLKNY